MVQPPFQRRISSAFVVLLREHVQARGIAPSRVGIAMPATDSADGIPLARWVELLERASCALRDPLLGLHLGQGLEPRHLGTLGYLLQSLPTLGDALQKLQRYQRLVYDHAPMIPRVDRDHVDLTWGAEQGLPGRLADDASISALIHHAHRIARGRAKPLRVQFIGPAPRDARAYATLLGCPVEFGASLTSVRYRHDTLALPLRAADASLSALMERQSEQLLAQMPQGAAWIDEVRTALARLLHEGEPVLTTVAARLDVHPRRLQRRLREGGTSFRAELEAVRRQLAQAYLRDARLSIADVAQLLGFSEHSAFTRGFRQWTGLSPQRWRERADFGR